LVGGIPALMALTCLFSLINFLLILILNQMKGHSNKQMQNSQAYQQTETAKSEPDISAPSEKSATGVEMESDDSEPIDPVVNFRPPRP
jgi:hypothetical protein